MSGVRDIIGNYVRLLADHPIQGPNPGQLVPSGPSQSNGFGNVPMTNILGWSAYISANAALPTVLTVIPPGIGNNLYEWGTPATNPGQNLLAKPTNVSGVQYACKFLKGNFWIPFTTVSGTADPSAPTGFTAAFLRLAMTITDDFGIVQLIQQDFTNTGSHTSPGTSIRLFTSPFICAYLATRTFLNFQLTAQYFDGGTCVITATPAVSGCEITIDV